MSWWRIGLVIVALAVLIGAPLWLRPRAEAARQGAGERELIVLTPHNEQIRREFARGFDQWHRERFAGEGVIIHWNTPGGTSEIVRMLQSQYRAALERGEEPGGDADLVFGGGSYEHEQLKRPVSVEIDGAFRSTTISAPIAFSRQWLDDTYGPNSIGDSRLFDLDQHWFGNALSGFGIVYNREVLARLGVAEPTTWAHLGDPALRGWVALVNPAQSGSITTAFEAILQRRGWEEGWRILRRAAANARHFSASAPKAPIEVSQGDAAMGVCIDFYGRYQSQAVADAAGRSRVGYLDPPGETSIDPDPVSMLRGAPHAETAQRFIEFLLTEPAQALWQFPARDPQPDGLGPRRYELRRLPNLRSMYERHAGRMIDQVNPYEIARAVENPNRDIRAFIAPLFAAMAMESHDELQAAWEAIVTHPAYPPGCAIVTAEDVADPALRLMLERFDAMPDSPGPEGVALSLQGCHHLAAIRQGWKTPSLWPRNSKPEQVAQVQFGAFFREQYQRVVELARGASDG